MFYFSGTGNSRYIAELFSEIMDIGCHSIEETRDFAPLLEAEETIAFCYPVHGSRVPRIMRDFALRYLEPLRGKQLIILCTQLVFSGDGARAFTDVFPPGHIKVIYAEHVRMPNNICNFIIMPLEKKETVKKRVRKAEQKVHLICDDIAKGRKRSRGFNPLSRALGLIQGAFYPGFERMGLNRVWIDDDCIKCLTCVSVCPMKNIVFEEGELKTRDDCTICCRCINECPQKAIQVFLHTKVKKQYEGVSSVLVDT